MAFDPTANLVGIMNNRQAVEKDRFGAPPPTTSGSVVAAKTSAKRWQRQQPATSIAPSPFQEFESMNPQAVANWNQQFSATAEYEKFRPTPVAPPEGGVT